MKNKKIIGIGLIFALALAISVGLVNRTYAAENDSATTSTSKILKHRPTNGIKRGNKHLTNPPVMSAKQIAINAALAANDYNAWLTAVGTSTPIAQKITASNFSILVQLYQLKQQEKTLISQLGLAGNGNMMMLGFGR